MTCQKREDPFWNSTLWLPSDIWNSEDKTWGYKNTKSSLQWRMLFIFFNFNFILFLTLQYCIGFVIYQHEWNGNNGRGGPMCGMRAHQNYQGERVSFQELVQRCWEPSQSVLVHRMCGRKVIGRIYKLVTDFYWKRCVFSFQLQVVRFSETSSSRSPPPGRQGLLTSSCEAEGRARLGRRPEAGWAGTACGPRLETQRPLAWGCLLALFLRRGI